MIFQLVSVNNKFDQKPNQSDECISRDCMHSCVKHIGAKHICHQETARSEKQATFQKSVKKEGKLNLFG
jgi:hypothetical protein